MQSAAADCLSLHVLEECVPNHRGAILQHHSLSSQPNRMLPKLVVSCLGCCSALLNSDLCCRVRRASCRGCWEKNVRQGASCLGSRKFVTSVRRGRWRAVAQRVPPGGRAPAALHSARARAQAAARRQEPQLPAVRPLRVCRSSPAILPSAGSGRPKNTRDRSSYRYGHFCVPNCIVICISAHSCVLEKGSEATATWALRTCRFMPGCSCPLGCLSSCIS